MTKVLPDLSWTVSAKQAKLIATYFSFVVVTNSKFNIKVFLLRSHYFLITDRLDPFAVDFMCSHFGGVVSVRLPFLRQC